MNALPSLRARARTALHTGSTATTDFAPASAAASLASSLKRLGRGFIDILLLHECRAADLHDDALLDILTTARDRGQIGAFGIGTDFATVAYAVASAPGYATIVQFANNASEPHLAAAPTLAKRACITHSPFGGVGKAGRHARNDAMRYAQAANPNGIVLFSSQQAEHIAVNVRAFEGAGQ